MPEYYYNFTVSGENRGYSYLKYDTQQLYSFTRFYFEENELLTNIFRLKISNQIVLACQYNDNPLIEFTAPQTDYYPSCAYPLFLNKASIKPYTYMQIAEADGSYIGQTELVKHGSEIEESRNGDVLRTFSMENNTPVRIDWGGAVSHWCRNAEESIKGSGLSFELE